MPPFGSQLGDSVTFGVLLCLVCVEFCYTGGRTPEGDTPRWGLVVLARELAAQETCVWNVLEEIVKLVLECHVADTVGWKSECSVEHC